MIDFDILPIEPIYQRDDDSWSWSGVGDGVRVGAGVGEGDGAGVEVGEAGYADLANKIVVRVSYMHIRR